MPFIETTEGDHINIDHVTKIIVPRSGDSRYVWLFAGDQRLGQCDEHQTLPFRLKIVPAPPGYSVVLACVNDNGASISEHPIIAFGFGGDGPVPFTVEGVITEITGHPWGIKCPSGVVVVPEIDEHDGTEAFLAYHVECRNRQARCKAAEIKSASK